MLLRNIDRLSTDYKALYPGKYKSIIGQIGGVQKKEQRRIFGVERREGERRKRKIYLCFFFTLVYLFYN
jgi:hypothetical protein